MAEISEADWLEGRDNWREKYGREAECMPTVGEIRQMANSHDGVPNDVFDRWLADHDRQVAAKVRVEALGEAQSALSKEGWHSPGIDVMWAAAIASVPSTPEGAKS